MFVAFEWDGSGFAPGEQGGQVEAVDGVEKQQRTDALIKVVALAAEAIEVFRFGEQGVEIQAGASGVE